MKKVNVKTLFLIGIITIGLIGLGIGSTYAMFTSSIEIDNPITINTTLTCEEEVIDTIDISIEANDFRVIVININNITSSNLNYSSFYISDNSDIEVGVTRSFSDGNTPTGSINSNSIKKVYIQVKNNSNTKVNVTIGVLSNSGNIIKSDKMILINDNNIDTVKPTVSISKNTSSSRSVTYTFNFSKKVSGFTTDDISVSEGTKSTFTKVSDRVYTLVVNHSSDGAKTITVNDNVCIDISGNGNAKGSFSHTIDTVKPSVTISANTSSSRTIIYTFTFSEDVTGFTSSDISVSKGTRGTFTKVSNSKYTLVVTHSSDGVKTIAVSAGVCTDNAGNGNTSKSYSHTVSTGTPLATYITNLYNSNTKSSFEYNKITYNRVESLSLINDRLGSSDTDIDGGNIRYYGTSPNNYVYFNCVSYPTTNCEVWRIVGVFDGKVKIIRSGSLASLSWDQQKNVNSSSTVFSSNWKTSSLNDLLNNKYYNGDIVGTVTYYSLIGATDTTELNMAQIGLRNRNTRSLVKKVTWNLGGISSGLLAVDGSYQAERGTSVAVSGYPTTIDTYIGLPYISDAGYASDLTSSACTIAMLPFTCIDSNWLHSLVYNAWTLTQYSKEKQKVWSFKAEGSSGVGYDEDRTWSKKGVVPTLFLDDSVKINDVGTGTQNNPYQLIVE